MTNESFGRRLRRERERRQIPLASISSNSKISVSLLEALERDDVSRWPSGIFRRAFMRSYAEAIGLNADEIVREFLERFPDPEAELIVPSDPKAPPRSKSETVLRLTLAESPTPFMSGRLLPDMRRRWAAVVWDAAMALAIAVLLFAAFGTFWAPLGLSTLGYYLGGILLLGNTPGVCLWARNTEEDEQDASA